MRARVNNPQRQGFFFHKRMNVRMYRQNYRGALELQVKKKNHKNIDIIFGNGIV